MKHRTFWLQAICISTSAALLIPLTALALGDANRASAVNPVAVAVTTASPPAAAPTLQPAASLAPAVQSQSPSPDKPQQQHAAEPEDPALADQLAAWIKELSLKPGFEGWAEAKRDVYPVGPGTHSWNVILTVQGREIGYIVVASTPEGGYQLMEYGAGANPLFSMNTLYQSLVQRELIPSSITLEALALNPAIQLTRWYIPPLQAFWQVAIGNDTIYFDAKNGEELPSLTEWLSGIPQSPNAFEAVHQSTITAVTGIAEWQTQDPLLGTSWLKKAPPASGSFEQWRKSADAAEGHYTYLGEWYGGLALYPLAVAGYHVWNETRPFLQLDHGGSRYVPYEAALTAGSLFPGS